MFWTLVWIVHSIIHNKTTNKSFNYIKKNINIHLGIKLYFSYIYCNVIALISLKKNTSNVYVWGVFFIFYFFVLNNYRIALMINFFLTKIKMHFRFFNLGFLKIISWNQECSSLFKIKKSGWYVRSTRWQRWDASIL